MLTFEQFFGFLLAATLITASPGPDNLMVLGMGISKGRRHGMAFGLGCALGCLSHTVLAAIGVSALIAASPVAFTALKVCGGLYLIWLGIKALRSRGGATVGDASQVETLILCSGRVTWDLMTERAKREDSAKFAIGRVERLYPSPVDEIEAEVAKYPNLKSIRWVQDEPRNMGPWPHYQLNVWPQLDMVVEPITRTASASPSVGTIKRHVEEQKALLDAAFESPRGRGDDY